jgi:hypothetical protein
MCWNALRLHVEVNGRTFSRDTVAKTGKQVEKEGLVCTHGLRYYCCGGGIFSGIEGINTRFLS